MVYGVLLTFLLLLLLQSFFIVVGASLAGYFREKINNQILLVLFNFNFNDENGESFKWIHNQYGSDDPFSKSHSEWTSLEQNDN